MNTTIRKAAKTDLARLQHIERTCFDEGRQASRQSLVRSLKSPSQSVWIADFQTDSTASSVGAMVLFLRSKTVRVFSIAVLPEYRGAGIGRQLIEHAIGFGKARGCEALLLEVDAHNTALVAWYRKQGFQRTRELPNYYGDGSDGYRLCLRLVERTAIGGDGKTKTGTRNLIVLNNPAVWTLNIPGVEVVSAKHYLTEKQFQTVKNARVFNLCNSYRYQSVGYYVSLLAAARNHLPIPSVTTIEDFRCQTIIQSVTYDIDELIQKNMASFAGQKEAIVYIFFGQTLDPKFRKLGNEIYRLFEVPLMKVQFAFVKKWFIQQIGPMTMKSVPQHAIAHIPEMGKIYFARKHAKPRPLKQYKYDLAILVNPDEKSAPSCPRALQKFKKAAEKLSMCVEFIRPSDLSRVVEFDALFIRETTAVEHHTYRFARKAHTEGLIVIDDPWSILRCANKVYLYERLSQGDIASPKTWVLQKDALRRQQLGAMLFPLVIKQPDSAFSRGVVKVNNEVELEAELARLFKISELLIAQEFIASEFDWRIGVLDQKPLFACKYFMARGHWQICNWNKQRSHRFGRVQTLPLEDVPEQVWDTAVRAANLVGDGLYGVDLKQVGDEVVVIEVNDNPNIDAGVEDAILKSTLYQQVMESIVRRIEVARVLPGKPG